MRRRQLRIQGFDYSSAGLYFVTACVRGKRCVLGDVIGEQVVLSRVGQATRDCLVAIPKHHGGAAIDAQVVMPNHLHAIIEIGERRVPLGVIVGTFKAAVARATGQAGLWQRGYYEHVIRDEPDLERIRDYIATNPIRWALDPENPACSRL